MENNSDSLDRTLSALADPTRRAIVARLCDGPETVSALAEPFAIGLPTLLKHLRVLEDTGLVRSEKQGRVRTCTLDPAALRASAAWFEHHLATWEARLDRMEAHVLRMKKEQDDANR